ncbi:hypothetical protein [Natrarchaeobaculum aegyptiacum]|uniref:Uncharacterized protein n=1 Tax=Natrarchaeobaculum aegyptiacum TaxID=745377 RepID=A0A2Z2HW40_9EURY|nr:hypothetical protein [Natrarchaeobaculum aegyptiacum]ARS89194.1 hypothetical protein B1756_05155 [Natrarchaeobaculum aegyptiacum]
MKRLGLFDMLQLAAGFSMAGPMFFIGIEFLRTGRPSGVGFLVVGAFALYFPTYLVNRIGGPKTWIRRRLGRPDSNSDTADTSSTDTADPTSPTDGDETSLLDRLRR